jgi:hypothetical protein
MNPLSCNKRAEAIASGGFAQHEQFIANFHLHHRIPQYKRSNLFLAHDHRKELLYK